MRCRYLFTSVRARPQGEGTPTLVLRLPDDYEPSSGTNNFGFRGGKGISNLDRRPAHVDSILDYGATTDRPCVRCIW